MELLDALVQWAGTARTPAQLLILEPTLLPQCKGQSLTMYVFGLTSNSAPIQVMTSPFSYL